MTISLIVITDGRRECLEQTLNSFAKNVSGRIGYSLLIDDSADPEYINWLENAYGGWFSMIVHHETRRGFAGAIKSAWDTLPNSDFVFHLEDDETFNQKVYLNKMAEVLTEYPYLAQIVLKRQPVNDAEIRAGGIVELAPHDYEERTWNGLHWTEHHRNFSTQPCLYPYFIAQLGFPQEPHNNERVFSDKLNEMGFRYCFWGKKFDPPLVQHIGVHRVGTGY